MIKVDGWLRRQKSQANSFHQSLHRGRTIGALRIAGSRTGSIHTSKFIVSARCAPRDRDDGHSAPAQAAASQCLATSRAIAESRVYEE
jgi:hypothetical protein